MSLVSKNVVVKTPNGIHFRKAGELANLATQSSDTIYVSLNGKRVDAKQALEIILLGAKYGSQVNILVEGASADSTFERVMSILK